MPVFNNIDVASLRASIINQINSTSAATVAALEAQAAKLDETKAGLDSSLTSAVDTINTAVSAVGGDVGAVNTLVNTVNDAIANKSVIKSIQRGISSIGYTEDTTHVLMISDVNPSKTFVTVNGYTWGSMDGNVTANLLSSKELQIGRQGSKRASGSSSREYGVIYWEVIEYA